MYNNISSSRSLPNLPNTSVTEETSKNAPPSVSERHDGSVSTSNPPIISTEKVPSPIREGKQKDTSNPPSSRFLLKHTTWPSSLQVEYRQQNAVFDGENSDRHLLQQFSSRDANSGRGVEEGDTTIVHIDDVHLATPATSSPPSRRTASPMGFLRSAITAPSWLTKNFALRKTGVILGETINHATIAALVWGTIAPLINQANHANSVDSGSFRENFRIAALNTLAMIPISFVLSNALFAILRGIMGYKIEKAQLDEALSDPGFVARFKSAQTATDYNTAIADVLYSCVFGAGMVAGSQIPQWAKEAGLSENNQQIINTATQFAIAAGALALTRTTWMLSRTVDGQPTREIKSLGHHNPIKSLAEQFKIITQTERKDEPSNISPNYRAMRNLVLRMLEEASVWGGTTLSAAPTGISTRAVREGLNKPIVQFLNGYMTVTLGYFFDAGNSLHNARVNEDFSPWKFLGLWAATKEFFLPDLPPPSSTVRALGESAGMATVAQSILKDIWNIGDRVLNAKNMATVYGPRIFLEIATSVEHEARKLLAHFEQYRTNQESSAQIEEIDSDSSEVALSRYSSTPLQTGDEEAISHVVEIAPTDTHDNPAPSIETTKQSSTNQKTDMQIEEIDLSKVAQAQNPSVPLGAGNEKAISHIVEVAPSDINDKAELAKQQQKAADLAIENETQTVDITDQSIALQAGEATLMGAGVSGSGERAHGRQSAAGDHVDESAGEGDRRVDAPARARGGEPVRGTPAVEATWVRAAPGAKEEGVPDEP